MARIDPKTDEPITDDPDQESEFDRGGRKEGDPGLKGASSTGGGNVSEKKL
jgi:hypothetical protein